MAFATICRKEQPIPNSVLEGALSALDIPAAMPRDRGSGFRRACRRLGKPAAALASCLALAGYGWTRFIEIEPAYNITEQALVFPNAFNEFNAAAHLMVEPDTIAKMLLPRSTRALVYGTGKPTGLQPRSGIMGSIDPTEPVREWSVEETEGLLRQNRAAIEMIRYGLGKPYLAPPIRSYQASTSHFAEARSLARLLRVDSETAAVRKRWGDAARSALDAVALGARIQENGGISAKLTGSACEAMGRGALWPLVDKLSYAEAMAAADRLTRILRFRPPYYLAIEEERNVVIAGLKEFMSKPGWRWTAFSVIQNGSEVPGRSYASYVKLLPFTKKRILENTVRHMDRHLALARQNWTPYDPYLQQPTYADWVTELFAPVYDGARFGDLSSISQSSLLIHSLQLRAYFAKHGRYPDSFNDFIQERLLRDPFSANNLIYRGFGDRYLLYSVGPDGVDNHGAQLNSPNDVNPDGERRYARLDSRGDIVAGVNTW